MDCQLVMWCKATLVNTVCVPRPNRLRQNVICPLKHGPYPLIGAMYNCVTSMKSPLFCMRPSMFHQLSKTVYISRHKMRNSISHYGANVSDSSSLESQKPNLNLRFCYLSRDYACYVKSDILCQHPFSSDCSRTLTYPTQIRDCCDVSSASLTRRQKKKEKERAKKQTATRT